MKQNRQGFTLIEMLLVMVVVSMLIVMGMNYYQQKVQEMRVDKATAQLQQILNAGLSYYVANGTWPTDLACLQGTGGGTCTQAYLPATLKSPWGTDYVALATTTNFYAYTSVTAASNATANSTAMTIAGRLPLGYVANAVTATPPTAAACSGNTCYVVSSVNIPGQNLNNATAVNFAGLYHHGACVPVPVCPVDRSGNTMIPSIIVVPAQISGTNDPSSSNVYPISSFTAYATAPATQPQNPDNCDRADRYVAGASADCTSSANSAGPAANAYWRVCVQVVTEKGDLRDTRASDPNPWGQDATVAAFTRCAISNESSGSTFSVFSN
jgi:prepilin-type N-terminal cleavage/methylation domain-containing protein